MKKTIFITALAAILILGCKKKTATATTNTTPPPNTTVNQQGTLAFSIGSGTYTAATGSLTCSLLNNTLNIYGATSSNIFDVNLFIPNTVGTYTLNAGSTYAIFGNNTTSGVYQTDATHTGTVVVTQYDATGKTVSGTYSFNALNTSAVGTGTSTVSITNGSFTNVSF